MHAVILLSLIVIAFHARHDHDELFSLYCPSLMVIKASETITIWCRQYNVIRFVQDKQHFREVYL